MNYFSGSWGSYWGSSWNNPWIWLFLWHNLSWLKLYFKIEIKVSETVRCLLWFSLIYLQKYNFCFNNLVDLLIDFREILIIVTFVLELCNISTRNYCIKAFINKCMVVLFHKATICKFILFCSQKKRRFLEVKRVGLNSLIFLSIRHKTSVTWKVATILKN